MDELAREFAGEAHSLFIYVREAHPGRDPRYPAHTSFEQKLERARELARQFNTPRTILVDSLDGAVHRVYGAMANMSWVVDHTGHVAFKGSWTNVQDLREALISLIRLRTLKRKDLWIIPYYKEVNSYRISRGRKPPPSSPEGHMGG